MKQAYKVKHGGLMRCCLLSLDEAMIVRPDDQAFEEGERLDCQFCETWMVYRDGAWQWERPAEVEANV